MKPSENLFDLIKSTTAQEQEAIFTLSKLHVKGDENKYLLLFQEIEKQDEFDEKALIKTLGYENDLNKFAFLKNYTYHFILKCLEERSTSPYKVIRSKISQANLLRNKKNFALAHELIKEAVRKAEKYQAFDLWIEASRICCDIAMEGALGEQSCEGMFTILQIIEGKESYFMYRRLFTMVRLKHHQTTFIKNIHLMKEFKAVYDEELMLANPAMNFNHKLYFYLSKGIVYYAKKEFDMAYIMVKELDKHWKKYPWMIETKFGAFYNTYYNKALIELNFKQFSQAIHSIEDLQKNLMNFHRENPFQRFMLFNLLIDVYRKCGYFEEALAKTEEYRIARETLHKPEENINSKQLYHFYLANIYFGVGDFKLANKHINEIINNSMDYNKDVTCVAHLMSLIIHYELGKTDLLIYRIKSVYRTLKKKECLLHIIDIVLEFLKDIAKTKFDPGNLKDKLVQLKEAIENEFTREPMEKEVMEYFDILSWITSKIEKKPFSQVIKAKSGYALG